MEAELRSLCAAQVPGDTHRNLRVWSRYSEQTFKHILVPIWLLTFNYGSAHYQAVINGYTGQIAGNNAARDMKEAPLRGAQPVAHQAYQVGKRPAGALDPGFGIALGIVECLVGFAGSRSLDRCSDVGDLD